MSDSPLADELRQFGLSDKETDTYLTILEHGEAKASTIADDAGVSKRYVYSISEKLEERGFVSVNDHAVPTTIRANPPAEVIDTLSRNLEAMRPELESRYSQTAPQSEGFEIIKSYVTVEKRVRDLVSEADEEIIASIPHALLADVADELRAAIDRGVLVVLILPGSDPADHPDLDGLASVARMWREPMPTMVVADRVSSLLAPTEMSSRSGSGERAIAFTQEYLAPVIIGSFFGNYWPSAEEVYVTTPSDSLGSYTDFRHAVLQATLHLRSGTELRATVRGQKITPGEESGELDGRVVEVRQGLVRPINNSFPVENALVVETRSGTYTIGGQNAFVEDFEATEVVLELPE
ncbi:TrmB family transcriptional regulator [Halorussus halophilus]|uniref:TrmB family transcriptional regulator n=1 Tax=Halorussus halophilus TaxID=2650975 RepID=UPI001300FD62|nr:TrmB family transcriptional regulator [Halorussus halophilus]